MTFPEVTSKSDSSNAYNYLEHPFAPIAIDAVKYAVVFGILSLFGSMYYYKCGLNAVTAIYGAVGTGAGVVTGVAKGVFEDCYSQSQRKAN